MGIPTDFNGVESKEGGGVIPDGDYIVRIDKATEIAGRTNGTPGIECTMTILVGDEKDRQVWDTVWVTPKTLPMVRHKFDVMGVPVPDGPFTIEPDHFLGRRLIAVVRQEAYTNKDGDEKTRAAVKAWKPAPSSGGADPLANAGNGIPTPAPPVPAATSDAAGGRKWDDDQSIPFQVVI